MTPDPAFALIPSKAVDRLAKLEREHAAVVRWLAAKDAETSWLDEWSANPRSQAVGVLNLRLCSPDFRALDELVGETRRALLNLETVAREVLGRE